MSEENKALARRSIEDIFNTGNLDVADEVFAADYVDHDIPPGLPANLEGFKQLVSMYRAAFPDLHITIEDVIAEGDKVVLRWVAKGTHQGDLMGIPPTNKQATVTGIDINRVAGGKIAEHWGNFDQMGMMQQLGLIPTG